jgi:hypothetical protein
MRCLCGVRSPESTGYLGLAVNYHQMEVPIARHQELLGKGRRIVSVFMFKKPGQNIRGA